MPIPVSCGGCGKRFQAPDRGAGKKVPCPACKAIISIPASPPNEEDDEYRLAVLPPPVAAKPPIPSPVATSPPRPAISPVGERSANHLSAAPATTESPNKRAWVPQTRSSTPTWLRHLHWFLALAMIPLAVSIFVPDTPATPPIIEASEESSPDEEPRTIESLEQMSVNDFFARLPGHKLPGAFLARDSYLHWLFALVAAAVFLTFLIFLASDKSAQPLHLLGLGAFTATGGIFLLLGVHFLSQLGVVRVGGIIGLVLIVLALIGLSYSIAENPDSGLVTSFFGFTLGVGLCEEVCKALPLLVYYRSDNNQTWRGAFLWGLASGTGFGVSEGIMYSQDFYNGISGAGIYIVRFVSCVALHAIWSGSVGISINQRQYLLQDEHDEEDWWMYLLAVLQIIAIPMVLHGLYDTLLKKDMEFLALLTAAASFGYLAWQISHLRGSDDEDERAAYVAQYIRSKAAMT